MISPSGCNPWFKLNPNLNAISLNLDLVSRDPLGIITTQGMYDLQTTKKYHAYVTSENAIARIWQSLCLRGLNVRESVCHQLWIFKWVWIISTLYFIVTPQGFLIKLQLTHQFEVGLGGRGVAGDCCAFYFVNGYWVFIWKR